MCELMENQKRIKPLIMDTHNPRQLRYNDNNDNDNNNDP